MYNTAVGIIENLRTADGNYSVSQNSSVCVLVTASGRVYSGITGTTAENSKKNSCAEYNAIVSMMIDGERRISKMMTVMFKNGEVVLPCEKCRDIIFKMDSENRNCEIAVSKSGTINLGVLMPASKFSQPESIPAPPPVPPVPPVNDFSSSMNFGNFDFESEEFQDNKNVFSEPKKFEVETAGTKKSEDDFEIESPSSVDYVTEVKADEDNPFYEPEIKNQKSNIVRDGNIEFEMYDPNKKEEIPKPKALNKIPVSNSSESIHTKNNNYYNSKYDTGVSQYNNFSEGFSDSSYQKNEQYQSPYNHGKNTINSGTSSSSYYYSQMSSSNSSQGSAGNSIYKQKLDNLLGSSSSSVPSQEVAPEQPKPEKSSKVLSKLEMLKIAKEKKRLAKIDAKFQKKIKKKGY